MIDAYILIQTQAGRGSEVARALAGLSGVTECDGVTGPYDVIAKVSAESLDELGRLVASGIQTIEGVTRTLTCAVMHF